MRNLLRVSLKSMLGGARKKIPANDIRDDNVLEEKSTGAT
jgi:hypothetical protein